MDEREVTRQIFTQVQSGHLSWPLLKLFLVVVVMMVLGTIGRVFVSGEEFDLRKIVGELCLAVVTAITLVSFGILQDLDLWLLITVSGLAGLGTSRSIELLSYLVRSYVKKK